MTRLKAPKLWDRSWEEEADGKGISPQLPGPESRGLDRTRRCLMLEGAPGVGQRAGGGFRQKQPQTLDTSAAAVGGRRRPPHARLALGCALFSALPRRNLRCERRSAAGSGRRATGRTALPRTTDIGAKRRKTTAPPGTASPLPALPGAPLPRHGKRQCHW